MNNTITNNHNNIHVIPEHVTFPADTSIISKCAFLNNSYIKTVNIPENITYVGRYAFNNAVNLNKIIFNNGLEIIDTNAFSNTSIKEIILPNTLKVINDAAFSLCDKLTTIKFGKNLISIGNEAFWGCTSLKGDIVLPPHLNALGAGAFAFTGIENITFNNNIQFIHELLFCECNNLKNVYFPYNIKNIQNNVFAGITHNVNVHITKNILKYLIVNDLIFEWKESNIIIHIIN